MNGLQIDGDEVRARGFRNSASEHRVRGGRVLPEAEIFFYILTVNRVSEGFWSLILVVVPSQSSAPTPGARSATPLH